MTPVADMSGQSAFPCRLIHDPAGAGRRLQFWKDLISPLGCWLWGGEVRDWARLPVGPVIVVANHLSTFDTLLLGWAMPRPAAFMAKSEIIEWPVVGAEAVRVGGFPARRGRGDQTAYLTSLAVLDAGHPVVLHPEGSRSPDGRFGMQRLRSGAARIALARPVPIQPVALFGTDGMMPRGRFIPGRGTVSAQFGEPIRPEAYLTPEDWPLADRIRAVNVTIDRAIRSLLPPHLQTEGPTPGLETAPVG